MHVRLPASELAIIDRAVSRLKMEVNREYSRSMLVREAVRRFLSETGDP
jgi:Arc/MetJ-type ribon-helix-helix transcriptional regulator